MSRKLTGCRMAHVAELTISDGEATYGTPKPIPDLEEYNYTYSYAEASNYADNLQNIYAKKVTGAEVGMVFSDLKKDVEAMLTGKKYSKGTLLTNASDQAKAVALLWQETYSDGSYVNKVFYNCKLSKDENAGKTEGESTEFSPANIVGKAIPLPNGDIMWEIDSAAEDVDQTVLNGWFTAVKKPADLAPLAEMVQAKSKKNISEK